ncbi:MAG: hypothetical protein IPN65_06725 [Elusimicrobia bacterium]|nr:hypothetical protein [Elusimicrobiota bacterium]MBK7207626.1 hypothetical protein [Elusimicrobiota bacterium]MBK7544396.1 hypothetical protein [Elusimicrobiota bacterium]MBK7573918.1 hypothetical protein [Elusimicrobiota bacterium]MBK7689516.1 hypothetical protein [Elusimicrobiota bacterium]
MIGRVWRGFWNLWADDVRPAAPVYDPVHVGLVLVGCLTVFAVLFWTLWALLVCEGGLFVKIGPLLKVVFTAATWADAGVRGPRELGVFEGWIVNLAGLAMTLFLALGVGSVLLAPPRKK